MGAVLEGIRVVDLTDWMYGARGTGYLADFGADVIKVESLGRGDPSRDLDAARVRSVRELPDCGWNYYFECNNRSKKSIGIDLRRKAGRTILNQLVGKSDVLATTWEESRLNQLKLDYDSLYKVNPGLVYATCSGFGKDGPDSGETALDSLAQSRSGVMSILGEPDTPPVYTGTGEPCAALCLAYAITMALFHRLRTGEGQRVDASLFGANVMFAKNTLEAYLGSRDGDLSLTRKRSRKDPANPLFNTYLTRDKWVFMCMLQTDRWWGNLMKAVGREDLAHDPRFDNHAKRCGPSRDTIVQLLDNLLPQRTTHEWFESKRDEIELIVTPINSFAEVADDPQAVENGYIVEYDHPGQGRIKLVGFPLQMTRTPARIRGPAPAIGQHTDEVLADLGYTPAQIATLRKSKIVR